MRIICAVTITLSLFVGPRAARAAPHDITVKVSPSGLEAIAQEVRPMIPTSFDWAGFNKNLFGCPFSSSSASVSLTSVKVNGKVDSLSINPGSGTVTADISARVSSGSALGSFYVCIGSKTTCTITFAASKVTARATFTPVIAAGKVELRSPKVTLDAPSSAAQINVSGCGAIGSVVNTAVPYIKGWLIDRIEGWLEKVALDNVPPAVEKALSGLTEYSGTLSGFKMSAELASSSASSSGLELGADASVSNTTTAKGSCAVPAAPAIPSVSTSPSLGSFTEHVGVAVSKAPLTEALYAAWRAGKFCLSSSMLKSTVGGATTSAGALLGFTQTDELSAKVSQAPKLTLRSGSDGQVDIAAPFTITAKGKTSVGDATVTAKTTVTLQTKLTIDPLTRALTLDVVKVSSDAVTLSSTNPKLVLPKAALIKAAIDAIALPALQEAIDGRSLVPQVLHRTGGVLDPYYLFIVRRSNTTSHIKLYAKLFRKISSDTIAPWTNMTKKPPKLIGAESFRFVATGGDGGTPTELLRFRWRVDGGSWTTASYSQSYDKAFSSGSHEVEVAAVDLHGNSDKTPSSVKFEVDAIAPTISVLQAPPARINATSADIEVTVNDNRSAAADVEVELRLERISGAQASLISEQPFARGATKHTLSNLQPGDYAVTLLARDEAGNVSKPVRVVFTREGASAPGQPGNPPDPGETPQPGQPGSGGAGAGAGAGGAGGAGGVGGGADPSAGASISGGCSLSGTDSARDESPRNAAPLLLSLALLALARRRRRRRRSS
ncbi:MAG: hypothetical protein KC503_00645 [Myxococcales bacterium]|nr:hypothetical protein [Myxococcales bacterium]